MTKEQLDALRGHTPGPWEVEYSQLHPSSEKCNYTIRNDAFDVVSGHLAIRREEDARLIAAAPDLLAHIDELTAESDRLREALIEAMPVLESCDCFDDPTRSYCVRCRVLNIVREALK